MHGRKALTIDDSSESTSVLTLNPENQENQQSIHYARNESFLEKGIFGDTYDAYDGTGLILG